MIWRALLQGELANQSLLVAREIAAELERTSQKPEPGRLRSSVPCGLALLHAYLAAFDQDEGEADLAWSRASRVLEEAAGAPLKASFFHGFAGLAWMSQHLEWLQTGEIAEEQCGELDSALLDLVRKSSWQRPYGLISGLVGIGCYALEHPFRDFAADLLAGVVDRLAELAQIEGKGAKWWTSPGELPPAGAQRFPKGYFDLGLAHGIPGIIALLGRACAAGLASGRARELLDAAVGWLLANRRPDDGGSRFGSRLDGRAPANCRSAWCQGDPGIAAALLLAARSVDEPAWEREAIALALHDTARAEADAGVVDACFCHGSAGLGHVYNRLYQATGEDRFAEAALRWLVQTLERWRGRSHRPRAWLEAGADWWERADWLEGATGIGLALLAAASPLAPCWDRPLLIGVEPRDVSLRTGKGREIPLRTVRLPGSPELL